MFPLSACEQFQLAMISLHMPISCAIMSTVFVNGLNELLVDIFQVGLLLLIKPNMQVEQHIIGLSTTSTLFGIATLQAIQPGLWHTMVLCRPLSSIGRCV